MMYKIFGDSPTIKIMEWLIENQEYDHSIKEVAGGVKLPLVVARRNFEPLETHNVVRVNRTLGRDKMYVLDLQNRCTKAIMEFDKQISKCCEKEPDEMKEPILILPPEI